MMQHLGDITKLDGATVEPVWCVTGGSPCQDLSIAGKRAGLAGARSGLFMEQIRVIKEMREHDKRLGWAGELIRPRYMVWENVVGSFSSKKGRDFAAVLEEIIKIVEPEAPGIEVPEKGWPTWGGYHDEVGGRWSVAWRTHDAQYWGVPQRRRRISVVADFGGDTASEILFDRKSVSGDIAESGAAGEGFAEAAESGAGGAGKDSGSVICLKGNAIDRDTAQNGKWYQEDKSYTLDATDRHGVCAGFEATHINLMVATRCKALGRGTGFGVGEPGDPANTISAAHSHGVLCAGFKAGQGAHAGGVGYDEEVSPTLAAVPSGTNQTPAVVVRRLTPLECERLQGFPDGWTDIGDYTDSTGKKRKTSDSARYKALGNSIALPFWLWMFGRMAAYLPEGATLGSLFDGIGGFPLCWENIHGAGTAIWASEIEEFPIAVTKLRFGGAIT